MSPLITYHLEANLALIGLASPPVNALGQPLRAALLQACERAASDPAVSVIIIHGANGVFCAGADITEFGQPGAFAAPALPDALQRQWQACGTWMAPHAKYVAVYDTPFYRRFRAVVAWCVVWRTCSTICATTMACLGANERRAMHLGPCTDAKAWAARENGTLIQRPTTTHAPC